MDCWVTMPLTRRWTAKLKASAAVASRRVDIQSSHRTLIGGPDGHRIKDKIMESNRSYGLTAETAKRAVNQSRFEQASLRFKSS